MYIKNVEFDLRSNTNYFYKNTSNELIILSNDFFQSSILMVGVYTSLCKLNTPTQIIMLPNKLFRYIDNSNYCESTLLGYIPIDVSTVKVNSLNNIIIDKTFDFESTVNKGKIKYNESFSNIENELLFFVPMYYLNSRNNYVRELTYSDTELSTIDKSKTYASKFYTYICLNNNNSITLTCSNSDATVTIESNDVIINDDEITIKNYNNYSIDYDHDSRRMLYFSGVKNVFLDLRNIDNPNNLITIDSNNKTILLKYFLNEPIEKNIKFNISPITNRSNIIYTTLNSDNRNELNKEIKYKFSLCSVNLSFTKNTGQYPVIIE